MDKDKEKAKAEEAKKMQAALKKMSLTELHAERQKRTTALSEALALAKDPTDTHAFNWDKAAREDEQGRSAGELKEIAHLAYQNSETINLRIIEVQDRAIKERGELPPAPEANEQRPIAGISSLNPSVFTAEQEDKMTQHLQSAGTLRNFSTNISTRALANAGAVSRSFASQRGIHNVVRTGEGIVVDRPRSMEQVVLQPYRPAILSEMLSTIMPIAGGDTYTWLRQQPRSGNFEGAVTGVGENAEYPEQRMLANEKTSTVVKRAVYAGITDEQLSDVSVARQFVQDVLSHELLEDFEKQIISGDGTAPNMTGILEWTGTTAYAKPIGTTIIDAYIRGLDAGYAASYMTPMIATMNHSELTRLRLTKDTDGNYLWGEGMGGSPTMLFGMMIAINQYISTNNAILLSNQWVQLLVKDGVEITFGYTGEDFTHGRQSVRAQHRANLVIRRPECIVEMSGLNTAEASE